MQNPPTERLVSSPSSFHLKASAGVSSVRYVRLGAKLDHLCYDSAVSQDNQSVTPVLLMQGMIVFKTELEWYHKEYHLLNPL
jgi:hypothetical protein